MKSVTAEFPMAEAKRICQNLFEANPWIYWSDFLLNDLIGWAAFILAVKTEPNFSILQIASFVLAGLTLYRAVIFVHELTHLKKGTFRVFHGVWNLLCGFPLMVPSQLYMGIHIDHHKQSYYGTRNDKEYFPFARSKPYRSLLFLLSMFLAPGIFLVRFSLLTPLSYLIQPLRKPLWEYASSLAVDTGSKRPPPTDREKYIWWIQEFMTFAYAATGLTLMAIHVWPWKVLAVWYLTAVFILFTNGLRTLVAHCYRNPPDREMKFTEQFLDSIDIPGNFLLTPLWAPVGLRFHATHHLFPGMPYHSLGKAHRKLLKELPAGSPYPLAIRKSLVSALFQLWQESSDNQKNN